jgi:putative flavoprotein involved in K+ transport
MNEDTQPRETKRVRGHPASTFDVIVEESAPVVIIGAGQAGLAVSHELTMLGVEHLILERAQVAQTWRDRWDSFCLVTPNWSVQLPGGAYHGKHPDGFMARDEIVDHLEVYANSFAAPVHEGVKVTSLDPAPKGGFLLTTAAGALRADAVVVATGAYQRPHRPPGAATLPGRVMQIDADGYRNEASLPPGGVLVVGSGQTGCQLAEELHEAGREVFLACGRAPWCSRRVGGRDVVYWAVQTGSFDDTPADLPSASARLVANIQATGRGGGHDLHYRVLKDMGVTLVGHFLGAEDGKIRFASDLAESVAFGDARYRETCQNIAKTCSRRGTPVPEMPEPGPFESRAPDRLDPARIGTVIFTSGFRPDYQKWVHFPAFDEMGFPLHKDGSSTVVPGLHFCGVHFLRKRQSALLIGVGEDASIVARKIAETRP